MGFTSKNKHPARNELYGKLKITASKVPNTLILAVRGKRRTKQELTIKF